MRREEETAVFDNDSFSDYSILENTPSLNVVEDSISNEIPELPFCWTNIIMEAFISAITSFAVFFIILEIHELVAADSKVPQLRRLGDYIEASFLQITFIAIAFHIVQFRGNRNPWYDMTFDNYPMLLILCFYVLLEMFYYIFSFIDLFTSCSHLSEYIRTTVELFFMIGVLPLTIISVDNNVKKHNIWLKFRTKATIILTMVCCMMIFTRKTAIELRKDINNGTVKYTNYCLSHWNQDVDNVSKVSSNILNILEVIDVNYFIIVAVLLINPLLKIENHNESRPQLETSLVSISHRFSVITCLSLVRFRVLTVFLSLILISITGTALYIAINAINLDIFSNDAQTVILLVYFWILSFGYSVGILYGTFYYFLDIKNWNPYDYQEYKTDQYFNYVTAFSQLVFSVIMIINLVATLILKPDELKSLVIAQIFNYILLAIQIMVQANCIHSASRRKIRKIETSEANTWKFNLIPPVFLTALNLTCMVASLIYIAVPRFNNPLKELDMDNLTLRLMKYVTLPFTILNRFHAMTFFMNLSVKQWQ